MGSKWLITQVANILNEEYVKTKLFYYELAPYICVDIVYITGNEVKFLLRFPEPGEYYFTIYINGARNIENQISDAAAVEENQQINYKRNFLSFTSTYVHMMNIHYKLCQGR